LDHKRFLILQGEVESISQMKAKATSPHEDGLLEYLEDIIGTSKYKQPIEDAGQNLDQLNEARSEKLTRLKIVEKEKNSLESTKQAAETFITMENNVTLKKSKLYQLYLLESDKKTQESESKLVSRS
jgi:structural maintenance of chromosome 4